MRLSYFSMSYIAVLAAGIVALTLVFSWNSIAQEGKSSLSGRVIDTDGKPVVGLTLAIKPVEIKQPTGHGATYAFFVLVASGNR